MSCAREGPREGMFMSSRAMRWVSVLVIAGLMMPMVGCNKKKNGVVGGVVGFVAGYILGSLRPTDTTTITKCFENGVQVDCSTLPPDILQ